jgi:5-formaminoimidazole-4-carboxamide-1-beta-D-ribofuranosyl 5'-monophosphate synthetase
LGYRFDISKKIGIGINIGATAQSFRQISVKNDLEKGIIDEIKKSFNSKLVEQRVLQQLFLTWRF